MALAKSWFISSLALVLSSKTPTKLNCHCSRLLLQAGNLINALFGCCMFKPKSCRGLTIKPTYTVFRLVETHVSVQTLPSQTELKEDCSCSCCCCCCCFWCCCLGPSPSPHRQPPLPPLRPPAPLSCVAPQQSRATLTMALGASRTLLALFVTLCTPGCGFSAEKPLRTNSGKQTSVDKGLRPVWEASIHLDGRPVDRFVMSSSRPGRSHRFTKWDKDTRANVFEDVDPEWVNLDGFAVLSAAPVNSAVPVRPPHSPVKNGSSTHRSARVNRTLHPSRQSTSRTSSTRTLRRAPQSSSGPRQPERYAAGTPLLERRRYHHTKPQSDQRNQRQAPKLTSESVHVVSLQAQKEQGQRAANRGAAAKTPIPEPPEYEARDISVRVMSPKSVLISWVDPAVEMGKVEPGTSRSYTVRYREKGESARWEYKDSTQRRMMIEDLSADGMYEFSVRMSQGKWSVSVFQRTPESAPSGPPENFEVKPLRGKGTAVIATWDPPEEPNGRIREYILSYAPAMKPFGMKSLTYSGSTSSATVDGLTPGERYIFKIRATNRRGQGPQSKAYSVAMPGSSRAASTPSKNIEVRRTTQAPSEQDTDLEESNTETTLAPTTTRTPTTTTATTTQRAPYKPSNRRVRPLSQTRSYHSIFSSVRGSVRNGGNRGASKIKEEQTTVPPTVKTTIATTTTTTTTTTTEPPTTTTEMVKPEQDNDVTLFEEEESKPSTTETPSLKIITPSPTKQAPPPPKPPKRRPVKIRVHQKPGSKASSKSSSTSSPTTTTTTTTTTPHIQESAAKRMDYTATAYPESKNIFDTPVQSKPSTSQDTSLQPEKETGNVGRGTISRTGGLGGRYGYNRRKPGILFRGNSTRNGYKPVLTSAVSSSNVNVPSRNQNIQLTPSRHSLASKTENSGTSNAYNPTRTASASVSNRQETTDGLYFDKSTNTQSKLQGGTTSNGHSTSHSSSEHLTTTKPTENSRSSSDGERHSKSDNTQNSRHASSREEEGSDGKRTANNQAKVEPASSSKAGVAEVEKASSQSQTRTSSFLLESANTGNSKQASSQNREGHYDRESDSRKVESSSSSNAQISEGDKTNSQSRTRITSSRLESSKSDNTENSRHTSKTQTVEGNNDRESDSRKVEPVSSSKAQTAEREKTSSQSRTRISSSLLEKYPWLATKYPHRFGSAAARTSTSVSTSRQDGKTPVTRTSPSSSTSSSIGAGRPISRGTPTRVSGAAGASGVSTIQETSEANEEDKNVSKLDSLKNNIRKDEVKPIANKEVSDTRQPATSTTSAHSSGPEDRSETVHRETITDNDSHEKEHIDEDNEKNGQKTPTLEATSKNTDNEREDMTNTRTISTSGVSPTMRRPNIGSSGRGRFGNRFSVRPAQNSKLDSESASIAKPVLTSDSGGVGSNGNTVTRTGGLLGGTSQSSSSTSSSTRDGSRAQGGRSRYPVLRGKPINGGGYKPANGNGKNGRPNLTTAEDKDASSSHESSKSNGQRYITRPDGTKWLVDLERGILMNSEGKILQDSQGRPKRVVLGEDGRTIFDHMGSPLVTQEGVALFGHGRDSSPVINPKDKVLMVGGKPVLGLDVPKRRTTSTTTTTTATTTTTTTTTLAPTTTVTTTEAPTTEWTSPPFPTCPPGTYSKTDDFGYPEVDEEGILDCYPIEEESSGMEDLEKDELMPQTTLLPSTTTAAVPTTQVQPRPSSKGPASEFDLSGKKRFTAPYVNYIQKDPGAPCSLTEALEYLQVDVLENLMEKDNMLASQNQPPKNKPHNLTVVAMEGCHSFIILDWARPLKDDMVSGYMVYSASYDDVLNNRWSSKSSSGTHLAVENLKPNSRYYFKVQAKNVFGLGPISETLTYITESDDPLLIERPPGGEPIWIPFSFKYNPAHSSCTGSQFVKRTWYRKFVGVILCNSLRYKIFMGDGLREPFYSIGDTLGQGEDHCQFVDSYRDGRTGPAYLSNTLPSAQGYYRAYRQEPVTFGVIGRRTNHPFVGWYECGVPIPGKW